MTYQQQLIDRSGPRVQHSAAVGEGLSLAYEGRLLLAGHDALSVMERVCRLERILDVVKSKPHASCQPSVQTSRTGSPAATAMHFALALLVTTMSFCMCCIEVVPQHGPMSAIDQGENALISMHETVAQH